jgi:hypothetical protein
MQTRTALLGTVLLTTAFIAIAPKAALNPGPVTSGHREIANDCLGCHTPLRGSPAAKCISCHPLDSVGLSRRSLAQPAHARPGLAGMHATFTQTDCRECHTDHVGVDPANGTKAFTHEALSPALHDRCSSCHEGNRPDDALHRQADGRCGACHATRSWTPASFKHDEYFALDRDHQARCATCHIQPANYREYTCYGCHAHTPTNIAAEHREEGISNLRNCVRCHRSASGEGGEGGRGGKGD